MARLGDVVVDCRQPASLARFWAAALDGYRIAPYDDAELARLRSLGIEDPEDDPTVVIECASSQLRLFFQRVPEPKTVKNRLHIDLRSPNVDAEASRLVALGARLVAAQPNQSLIALRDPENNEFCLLRD